ncbi:hypothetical protein EK21DRAFT_92518 [Setomelanomma holmii]|uniref:Apple domain-containing protein n=1 Tax=Setomelanomma holmii TaxID=210430 RepID=A0A9P4H0Z8_9PLEO|nr:hypothetical protein EK21DRAFT_92518 [Setomelanomma holmii]
MHSFTAIVAASALLSAVSGAPLSVRSNTCGAAPAGSNTNNQPIEQPTGIKTANDCLAKCNAESKCQAFIFGLVDNAIKCELFSVPAASIPRQSSTNFVAYDKACPSVPSVIPTISNPTGKGQDNTQQQSGSENTKQSGSDNTQKQSSNTPTIHQKTTNNNDQANQDAEPAKVSRAPAKDQQPTPTPTPAKQEQAQQPAKEQIQQPTPTPTPAKQAQQPAKEQIQQPTPTPTPAKQAQQPAKEQTQKQTTSDANTCGSKPAGSGSSQPISQPTVDSVDACKVKCQAVNSCKSFTFGAVDNKKVCKLFNVAASSIPAPSDAAQKQAFVAYDVGCSI